jgi:hypothetical protein
VLALVLHLQIAKLLLANSFVNCGEVLAVVKFWLDFGALKVTSDFGLSAGILSELTVCNYKALEDLKHVEQLMNWHIMAFR